MNAIKALALSLAVLVAPALASAQVDESAKAILAESAKAIRESNGLSFKSKRSATGMLKDIIDSSGEVKVYRNPSMAKPMALVNGRVKQPAREDMKLNVMTNGSIVQWLDWDKNLLVERPAADREADGKVKLANQILPQVFLDEKPFEKEMNSTKITRLGNETIGGEVCEVISISPNPNASVTWAISAIDRLPRRWVQSTGEGDKQIAMMVEISDLKPTPMSAKDFDLPLPTNFTKNVKQPVVQSSADASDSAAPVVRAKVGLEAGTPVPTFSLTDASGQTFSNDSLKGHFTLLHFFGTTFKSSTAGLEDLQSIADKYQTQNLKVVGMACREPSDKSAKDLFSQRLITYPLVPKADSILADFKVMGFPSYYIIDAAGKVVAYLTGAMTLNELAAAIDNALARK